MRAAPLSTALLKTDSEREREREKEREKCQQMSY